MFMFLILKYPVSSKSFSRECCCYLERSYFCWWPLYSVVPLNLFLNCINIWNWRSSHERWGRPWGQTWEQLWRKTWEQLWRSIYEQHWNKTWETFQVRSTRECEKLEMQFSKKGLLREGKYQVRSLTTILCPSWGIPTTKTSRSGVMQSGIRYLRRCLARSIAIWSFLPLELLAGRTPEVCRSRRSWYIRSVEHYHLRCRLPKIILDC